MHQKRMVVEYVFLCIFLLFCSLLLNVCSNINHSIEGGLLLRWLEQQHECGSQERERVSAGSMGIKKREKDTEKLMMSAPNSERFLYYEILLYIYTTIFFL